MNFHLSYTPLPFMTELEPTLSTLQGPWYAMETCSACNEPCFCSAGQSAYYSPYLTPNNNNTTNNNDNTSVLLDCPPELLAKALTNKERLFRTKTTTTTQWTTGGQPKGSLAREHAAGNPDVKVEEEETQRTFSWTQMEDGKKVYYTLIHRRRRRRYTRVKPVNTTSFKKSSSSKKNNKKTAKNKSDTTRKRVDVKVEDDCKKDDLKKRPSCDI